MAVQEAATSLIDNSGFAGVVRSLRPSDAASSSFWKRFPDHKAVDLQSYAVFLTAVCLFDRIRVEATSKADDSGKSWVEQQLDLLPKDIAALIAADSFYYPNLLDYANGSDEDADVCRRAFDIMRSDDGQRIKLKRGQKLPNVYSDGNYVYMPTFQRLNQEARKKGEPTLNEEDLQQAMFLHRGLYLGARACKSGITYLPYHYRGQMLSMLSPLIYEIPESDGFVRPHLPLATGRRPQENEWQREMNEAYYRVLAKVQWESYDAGVPFVGAAILAKAKGNLRQALDDALSIRNDRELRHRWDLIREAVKNGDKGEYQAQLKRFEKELEKVAEHLGAYSDSFQQHAKLATACFPSGFRDLLSHALDNAVPEPVQRWVNKLLARPFNPSVIQMLFVNHVGAARSSWWRRPWRS